MGVGTPQKKWLRHDWVGGSLREKIIHFILAPSETYLLARFDPLAVTILETLAVITSAGYAPRANLVVSLITGLVNTVRGRPYKNVFWSGQGMLL